MNKIISISLLALVTTGLHAQSGTNQFNRASIAAQDRLEAALNELDRVQSEISSLRPELGARLDEVENLALSLRDEANNVSRIRNTMNVEVSQLQSERTSVRDNNNYIQSTLLNEYIRRLELTIDPSEIPLYAEKIRSTLQLLDTDQEISFEIVFRAQLDIVRLALARIEKVIGGATFNGTALVDGTITDGSFLLLGPASYFTNQSGIAGITAGMRDNLAAIYSLPNYAATITATINAGGGLLPVDTTKGEALESITQTLTLAEEIALGGFVMFPILGLFAIAILIALFKSFELMRVKAAKTKDIQAILSLLEKEDNEGALAHAKSVGGPVGDMLCAAVESVDKDREVIEEVLYEKIIKTQPNLERFLPFIAVVAATAPLLGLLGTVTGMIKTFKLITIVGTGDARNLSSGISEALITTKWGLIVAIPTLIMHALLNRKAKGVVGSMEQAAVSFINAVAEMRSGNK